MLVSHIEEGVGLNYSRLNPMLTETFYFTGVTDNDTNVSTLAGLLQSIQGNKG